MSAAEGERINKQVEYYFSDANVVRDKFLLSQIEKGCGWVPVSVLNTFSRMKAFGKTDREMEAILSGSSVLDVKDGKIARKTPIPQNVDTSDRTLMVRNFRKDSTLEDIEEMFRTKRGSIARISMRRTPAKEFKGSVIIEAFSAKEAEEIRAMEWRSLSENEREDGCGEGDSKRAKTEARLELHFLADYYAEKKKKAQEAKEEKKDSERREIVDAFKGKFYTFATVGNENKTPEEKDSEDSRAGDGDGYLLSAKKDFLKIANIKGAIGDCAFVDAAKGCLRLKEARDLDGSEFAVGAEKILLRRMGDEEVEQYCRDINFEKESKRQRRQARSRK